MQKYKGNEGVPLKKGEISKGYHVYTYTSKEGETRRFAVWATQFDDINMMKIKEQIIGMMNPMSYDL